jgi:drug/metabolite transporter (DMT)-like permease
MANIPLAIGLGVLGAVVYGTSIVIQHRVVHGASIKGVEGIWRTLRNPVWLLAVCGDVIGFVLNVVALTQGPVVLVQPLVVLMLPVAMIVGYLMGGPRPRPLDLLAVAAVVGGLGGFLALIGEPLHGFVPGPARLGLVATSVLALSALAIGVTWKRSESVRGAVFGGASGACFGTLAVMINAITDRMERHGLEGIFGSTRGWVALVCAAALGVGGMTFAMISFQIGKLPAVLPTNLAFDPLSAVLFGSLVLKEHIPSSAGHILAYAVCLTVVIIGAIQLAKGTDQRIEGHGHSEAEMRGGAESPA